MSNNLMNSALNLAKKMTVNQLEGNKPVSRVGAGGDMNAKFFGGVHGTYVNMKKSDMGFMDAVKTAHQKTNDKGETVMNWGAVAGSAMTAGAAMRVASGGGLYRDENGNTDVIGVPFI